MPAHYPEGSMAGAVENLERLRQRASDLQEMAQRVQDAAPARTEAADRAGVVRVVVGADGLPESIQVESRWQERIRPQDLGAAITEASQQALSRRNETWSRTFELSDQQGNVGGRAPDAGARQAPYSVPTPGYGGAGSPSVPRSLSEISEDVIGMLDSVTSGLQTGAAPAQVQGFNPDRTLSISLTRNGQFSCTVDAPMPFSLC